jgi:hypothetical protein
LLNITGKIDVIGGHSDTFYQEFSSREKRWKKISDNERKIKMVQDKIHLITVDREIEVA